MFRFITTLALVFPLALSMHTSVASADVVIDMPPPVKQPAEVPDTTASHASKTTASQATPAVGNLALYRYARSRSTPYGQYYQVTRPRRFGGYVTPTYYYRWGHPWYGHGFGSCGGPHWSPWFWMSPGFSYQIHH